MSWSTRPQLTYLDGKKWRLDHPVIYFGRWDTFTIPSGFITDWDSIPKCVRSFVPKHNTLGSLLHDYLYREAPKVVPASWRDRDCGHEGVSVEWSRIERDDADKLYCRVLTQGTDFADGLPEVKGLSNFYANVVYRGLQLGGAAAWRRYREQE